MRDLQFLAAPGRLGQMTHIVAPKGLELCRCANLRAFLDSLALDLVECDNVSTKELSVIDEVSQDSWNDAISTVLDFMTTLEALTIISCDSIRPSVAAIGRHGNSLRRLHLDPLNNWQDESELPSSEHRYTIKELQRLIVSCPLIEELGMDLFDCEMSQGSQFTDFLGFSDPAWILLGRFW